METLMKIIEQETGVVWYPLLLIAILIIVAAIIVIWGRVSFRGDYNENSSQTKPFNSGNLDEINYNIKSSNLYWGFKNALGYYYTVMEKIHTGDLNDYMKWLVITLAICLILICGGII